MHHVSPKDSWAGSGEYLKNRMHNLVSVETTLRDWWICRQAVTVFCEILKCRFVPSKADWKGLELEPNDQSDVFDLTKRFRPSLNSNLWPHESAPNTLPPNSLVFRVSLLGLRNRNQANFFQGTTIRMLVNQTFVYHSKHTFPRIREFSPKLLLIRAPKKPNFWK